MIRHLLPVRALLVLAALLVTSRSRAATFTVSSTADIDGTTCAASCTLRQAINAANGASGSNAIVFDTAVFATRQTISFLNADLPAITSTLSITGSLAGVTLDTPKVGSGQVISVNGGTVNLVHLAFTNGYILVNNVGGNTTVQSCSLLGKGDGNSSAGLLNFNGTLTVRNCCISGCNKGIRNTGTSTVQNSTVISLGGGTGLDNSNSMTVQNCTVTGPGTQMLNDSVLNLANSIVVGDGTNTNGTFNNQGNNITTGTAFQAGLQLDPNNGSVLLTDNGGPTQTIALTAGSPAINGGSNALVPNGVTTDQRGGGYARIVGGSVDIGAFESQVPSAIAFSPASGQAGTVVTITGAGFSGASSVKFNGTAASSSTVVSDTQIKSNVPPAATTGPITVVAANGTGTSASSFTVTHPPVAQDQSLTTKNPATITLRATDADVGDTLTYFIVALPANGTLGAVNGNKVTYTPTPGYMGADSFTFKANDGTYDSNIATVSITVAVPQITVGIASPANYGLRPTGPQANATGSASATNGVTGINVRLYRIPTGSNASGYWDGVSTSNPVFGGAPVNLTTNTVDSFAHWNVALPTLTAGSYRVYATAYDSFSNSSAVYNYFVVNTDGAVTANITSPANNSVRSSGAQSAATGTATSTSSVSSMAVRFYQIPSGNNAGGYWDGISTTNPVFAGTPVNLTVNSADAFAHWNVGLPTLPAGSYALYATAYDNANNSNQAYNQFTVQLQAASTATVASNSLRSSSSADSAINTITLAFVKPLDPTTSTDTSAYTATINGLAAIVQSVAYSVAANTITLSLAPNSMHRGDSVDVMWTNLRTYNGTSFSGESALIAG